VHGRCAVPEPPTLPSLLFAARSVWTRGRLWAANKRKGARSPFTRRQPPSTNHQPPLRRRIPGTLSQYAQAIHHQDRQASDGGPEGGGEKGRLGETDQR
jgi:hypothetical protein